MAPPSAQKKNVLHLIGSTKDEYYYDLSVYYCRVCDACPDLDRERYNFLYAIVGLDGMWCFPDSLQEDEAIAAAPRMPLPLALAHLETLQVDVMVPHMFCVEGMTRYRSLFDLLGIPFLGNHEYTVWPATDKAITKQLLAGAGVQCPRGDLLVKGEVERPTTVGVPCVVKPCNEDNSRGITLVRNEQDLAAAIDYAFSFDPRVIVDEYIAGREVRVACIEEADGSLTVLPKLEYYLEDIRTSAHKLGTDKSGKLSKTALQDAKQHSKGGKDGDRKCPADLSPELSDRIDGIIVAAHKAMKCRHYSLFDLRIDVDEQPYILEACFFCSFSPMSVIPSMAAHAGREDLRHPNLFHSLLERTIAEKEAVVTVGVAKAAPIAAPASYAVAGA
jgi:D-alanine-D-alanine ligase